jgi:hypothetical protein
MLVQLAGAVSIVFSWLGEAAFTVITQLVWATFIFSLLAQLAWAAYT